MLARLFTQIREYPFCNQSLLKDRGVRYNRNFWVRGDIGWDFTLGYNIWYIEVSCSVTLEASFEQKCVENNDDTLSNTFIFVCPQLQKNNPNKEKKVRKCYLQLKTPTPSIEIVLYRLKREVAGNRVFTRMQV